MKGDAKRYAGNTGQSYGEWAEPADVHPNKWTDMIAPHPEESTAYTAYVLGLMAEISTELGHTGDAERFQQYSEGCKTAYQELADTQAFTLNTDRQARLVRPLAFDLLSETQTAYASVYGRAGARRGTDILLTFWSRPTAWRSFACRDEQRRH